MAPPFKKQPPATPPPPKKPPCRVKAGDLACLLPEEHAGQHKWDGLCDSCKKFIPDRILERDGKKYYLCILCEDDKGSRSSGMIVNRQPCMACPEPATRWIDQHKHFFCDAHGPDKDVDGEPYPVQHLGELAPLTSLVAEHEGGDFFSLYRVEIRHGRLESAFRLLHKVPYFEIEIRLEQEMADRFGEAPLEPDPEKRAANAKIAQAKQDATTIIIDEAAVVTPKQVEAALSLSRGSGAK